MKGKNPQSDGRPEYKKVHCVAWFHGRESGTSSVVVKED
jgi:hypothetical protein